MSDGYFDPCRHNTKWVNPNPWTSIWKSYTRYMRTLTNNNFCWILRFFFNTFGSASRTGRYQKSENRPHAHAQYWYLFWVVWRVRMFLWKVTKPTRKTLTVKRYAVLSWCACTVLIFILSCVKSAHASLKIHKTDTKNSDGKKIRIIE